MSGRPTPRGCPTAGGDLKKPSVFAEENLAGLKDSMFEIINEMVKDCWAEKTAKTEAEKEAAVNQLKAFVAMFFEPEN